MHYRVKGLTAKEVEISRFTHGVNSFTPVKTKNFCAKFVKNLKDPIIVILIVALGLNIMLFFFGYAEWFEGFGIAVAVLLATVVTTFAEHKNETAFQKLQEESSNISCKVIRDGNVQEVPIFDVVVGDCVVLQPGDLVPADARVVLDKISVIQAVITGEPESIPKKPAIEEVTVDKELDPADPDLVFRGTTVSEGEAVVEVVAVGDKTVYGRILSELAGEERLSPLQVRLSHLAVGISRFGYIGATAIACSFMFKRVVLDNNFSTDLMAGYLSNWQHFFHDALTAIILATIIIVVAVPEGLPMMIALVLSMNVRKMLQDNVLVRKLIGIETAGSLNILFTDKTGTITKGRLEATLFMSGDGNISTTAHQIPSELRHLLAVGVRLSSSCFVSVNESGEETIIGGNPTERALMEFVGAAPSKAEKGLEVVRRIPFSSERKFSAVRLNDNGGPYSLTFIKGAPDYILPKCTDVYDRQGRKSRLRQTGVLMNEVNRLGNRAMRVIAVAATEEPLNDGVIPPSLSLIGLVAIRDEIRDNLVPVIKETMQAGIQVVMLTGDKKKTASAIARECGIMDGAGELVLSSQDLKIMSDQKLVLLLPRLRVVERALPSDKSRLVQVAQNKGLVAGMTGDGVNDATALQKADVGFALGSGTEAAKEAGDIVILDDKISSITRAVLFGRTIFNSIRKFIVFQFTVNLAVIIIAFTGPFIGFDMPLTMVQLLWINLVMDTLAALAYGGEPPLKDYMLEKPKRRDEPIVNVDMWSSILFNGLAVAVLGIIFLTAEPVKAFFQSEAAFMTGFFAFFVFIHNFNKFNARTPRLNLFYHILKNKGFLKVVILIFAVQVFFTHLGGEVMRTVGLSLEEWIFVFALSTVIVPLDLARKLFRDVMRYIAAARWSGRRPAIKEQDHLCAG